MTAASILLTCLAGLAGCTTVSAGQGSILAAPLQTGVLAGDIGASLSPAARAMAAGAEYAALERGQTGLPVDWRQSEQVSGSVVPQQPYSVGSTTCRRYVHTVMVGGTDRSATGTACRSEDGVWEPLS